MQDNYDHDYDLRYELPEFEAYDDGRFRCLTLTLADGRYVVVTDIGGMGYPSFDDFNVCVYRSEQSFGDDPTDSLIASATSDNFDDIEKALAAVEFAV
jgi:hypothetical protein